MAIDVSALIAEVQRETSVEKGALKVIQTMASTQASLSQQLADAIAANDPAKLAAVQAAIDQSVQTMKANDDELAAAIVANTPAATPPASQPVLPICALVALAGVPTGDSSRSKRKFPITPLELSLTADASRG
jgi:hypothetical protein